MTGAFILDYEIQGSGSDTFGLNPTRFLWSGVEGSEDLDLNTSGTLTRTITAGDTFTVTIESQANIFGGLGTRDASYDGVFKWRAVPEPSAILGSIAALSFGILFKKKSSQKKQKETLNES